MKFKRSSLLWLILILWAGLASGCVTANGPGSQSDAIMQLQDDVRDLKDQARLRDMEMDRLLNQSRDTLPEIRVELDRLTAEVQRLIDAVEITEASGGLPGGQRLSLKDQLNHIRARLDRLETKLRLPPLSLLVLEQQGSSQTSTQTTSGPTTTPPPDSGPASTAGNPDQTAFNQAKGIFEQAKFSESRQQFQSFLERFPKSGLAASAQFYVAECYYREKDYERAIVEYQKVVKNYSNAGDVVSVALLRQAYSFLNIGDQTSAKLLFRKVVREYPNSDSAGAAKKKLNELK